MFHIPNFTDLNLLRKGEQPFLKNKEKINLISLRKWLIQKSITSVISQILLYKGNYSVLIPYSCSNCHCRWQMTSWLVAIFTLTSFSMSFCNRPTAPFIKSKTNGNYFLIICVDTGALAKHLLWIFSIFFRTETNLQYKLGFSTKIMFVAVQQ